VTPLATAVDLRLAYGSRVVLEAVSVEIEPGERLVITGRSGSGKTTLLLALAGLLQPDAGTVRTAPGALMYVPQAPSLVPELTALENVVLAQRLRGTDPARAAERAQAELRALGIEDAARALPAQLSGGMAARTALARALALDPPGLLVDEPTGTLDRATGAMVLDELLSRAAAGTAVVVSTHDGEVAARMREGGARALSLDAGRLVHQ